MATNTLLRQLLRLRHPNLTPVLHRRTLSTKPKPFYHENPSKFVTGITTSDLDTDPAIAEFFAANFDEEDDISNPDVVQTPTPREVLETIKKKREDDAPLLKLNIRPLVCSLRDGVTEEGSKASRYLRTQDWVPGLVYGRSYAKEKMSDGQVEERVFVKTPFKNLQREKDTFGWDFRFRVYELRLDEEEPILVTPANCNVHPVRNEFFCMNYLRYYAGRPVNIPFRYVNEEDSAMLKRGGFIIPLKRNLEVVIEDGVPIPEFLPVDCTNLIRNNVLKLDRLIMPEGVTISKDVEQETFMIGTSRGKRIDDEE